MSKKEKSPWPTKAVMQQIYKEHLWGGQSNDFYSGEGSHNFNIITTYIHAVKHFFESKNNDLVVADLGCGDFNIGKQLFEYTKHYYGVDIVPELIAYNKERFRADNLTFECLDISIDQLPKTDCVIVRQVFQHLSNKEIRNILQNIKGCKYVILTEHLPIGNYVPNKDIIAGQGIRLKLNSGVDILKTPFSLNVNASEILDKTKFKNQKGCIVTTLYVC